MSTMMMANKENAPATIITHHVKPRMVGIGRPAKTLVGRTTLKKRGASISKAKLKAASLKRRISIRKRLRSKSKKMNRMVSGETTTGHDQTTKLLSSPSTSHVQGRYHSTTASSSRVILPAVGYPFRLMRDPIPPVTSTTTDGITVPIDYMMKHLTSHLPLIWQTRWEYVAAPEWYYCHLKPARLPPASPSRIDDVYDDIPIYVKNAQHYGGLNSSAQQKFAMRAPTVCLAVRQEGVPDQPAYLCPINEAVLTSRCAYYDQLASRGRSLRKGTPITKPSIETPEQQERRIDADLVHRFWSPAGLLRTVCASSSAASRTSISIEDLLNDRAAGTSLSEAGPSFPSALYNSSTLSNRLECDPNDIRELIGYRKVPLVPIYVPHYPSVHCLFHILHHPDQPFAHLLLSVEPLEAFGESEALDITTALSPNLIIQLMNNLHGLVRNVNAFGISNEFVWSQLVLTQRILTSAMERRGAVIRPDKNYLYFPNVQETTRPEDYEATQVERGARCGPGSFWFPPGVWSQYRLPSSSEKDRMET